MATEFDRDDLYYSNPEISPKVIDFIEDDLLANHERSLKRRRRLTAGTVGIIGVAAAAAGLLSVGTQSSPTELLREGTQCVLVNKASTEYILRIPEQEVPGRPTNQEMASVIFSHLSNAVACSDAIHAYGKPASFAGFESTLNKSFDEGSNDLSRNKVVSGDYRFNVPYTFPMNKIAGSVRAVEPNS